MAENFPPDLVARMDDATAGRSRVRRPCGLRWSETCWCDDCYNPNILRGLEPPTEVLRARLRGDPVGSLMDGLASYWDNIGPGPGQPSSMVVDFSHDWDNIPSSMVVDFSHATVTKQLLDSLEREQAIALVVERLTTMHIDDIKALLDTLHALPSRTLVDEAARRRLALGGVPR